ncbi:hypothetical protein AC482_05985 [miscellaneous Crenarchaeota group-15 archaeon DG-45]|uniref:Capsule synthesis protein CapA domain-containing protein n=1 Tax=miscellaneous Crenarchaeota group-15 archaeon DG-45 TaxID=1685127 RepID=A0A0M0BMJ5_9ARCH|nr:MAG: hypothetical protein AC482_05985 [miscellaneous Crenarchaeota group-15 archaeon DG-45]
MSDVARCSGEFTLVATGDSLIFQRLSIFKDEAFLKVREIIRRGDAAYANFETLMRDEKGFPRYKRDPTAWMTSPRFVLDELRWMGFSLFSLANNHSMDYSEEGLLENLRIFEGAGVTHAGTGRNLSEARAPAYLDTEKARVALVSVNTGGEDGCAGDAWGRVPGRPGVNPLRYTTTVCLEKPDFETLASISRKLDLPEPGEGGLNFLESVFEVGERADIHTAPYGPDLEGNLRSISEARENADLVFVAVHNHVKRRPGVMYFDDTLEHIAGFVEAFSRAAVDAGADAVLGTGTHCLNGIEIYRGRPIFYGLGNFIYQSYRSNPRPYDWYEARGLHEETHPDESGAISLYPSLTGAAEERRIRRLTTSVVAEIVYDNGRLRQVVLYPIETPRHEHRGGRPILASGPKADEILGRLSGLSAEYGTTIDVDRGIGRIVM